MPAYESWAVGSPSAGSPPDWGRDALRRAVVFAVVLLTTLAAGAVVVVRTCSPAPEEYIASAQLEQPAGEALDPDALRKALVQPERIEAAVHALPRVSVQERQTLSSGLAARINVTAHARNGTPGCRITLGNMPELAPRRALTLLDQLLQKYVEDLHDARVAIAGRRETAAAGRVEVAGQKLKAARQELDQCIQRLASTPPVSSLPPVANTPAVVAEVAAANTLAAAERAELEHQLIALGARREMLLERRTPAHPDVVDIEDRIAAVEARLVAAAGKTAPQAIAAPAAVNAPAVVGRDEQKKLLLAQTACQHAESELAATQQDEREAHDMLVKTRAERQEVLTPASVPPVAMAQPRAPWLLAVVALGLLLAWCTSACVRPATIRSPAELQRVLHTPVVGVLPADLLRSSRATGAAA